jgi:hypothetical protein
MGLDRKNGRPLQVSGGTVYSNSGAVVGRISNDKVSDLMVVTLEQLSVDCLVYRSTESASVSGSFAAGSRARTATAARAGCAIWGNEPRIPD